MQRMRGDLESGDEAAIARVAASRRTPKLLCGSGGGGRRRQVGGRADVVRELPVEGVEELEEIVSFIEGEDIEGVDFLVEMSIPVAAADVVSQSVLDGGESAVVH